MHPTSTATRKRIPPLALRTLSFAVALSTVTATLVWLDRTPVGSAHAVPPSLTFGTGGTTQAPGLTSSSPASADTSRALPDFAAIVDRHGAAVVNISVAGTVKTALPKFDGADPFEFFRRFGIPGMPAVPALPHGGERQTQATGSGFIVNPDGVVLTNAHVVADADEVTVKLTDKREFKAKVIGIDKPTDVAVLKIDASGLPAVAIGDPRQTRVGEWVVAIGSPFGFESSVTSGIVSAKSRSLPQEGYVPFIQTDVAINPGNSGGPLFNLKGEVIGINSQIYSRSGGYQGVSFAIPIDVAMKVERQLIDHGKVQRGRLGVTIQEVDQALAGSFGLDKPHGALVSEVENDGPAAKAGLKPGDVVLKFNGTEIARSSDLPPMVADLTPGSQAEIEVWRDGKSKLLGVHLGEAKTAVAAKSGNKAEGGKLGLALRPLTDEEKRQSKLDGGLVVEDVAGAAQKAGIQAGDVVLAINGTAVSSVEELRLLSGKAGKNVALLVQRGERKLFVPLKLG